jgi:hypothetical protein
MEPDPNASYPCHRVSGKEKMVSVTSAEQGVMGGLPVNSLESIGTCPVTTFFGSARRYFSKQETLSLVSSQTRESDSLWLDRPLDANAFLLVP